MQSALLTKTCRYRMSRRSKHASRNRWLGKRFNAFLLGIFSALAVTLAAVGLYGVLSYVSTQRTREVGIRIALGAETGVVVRQVLWQGLRLALVGIAAGIAAALALTRLIRSLLFGVSVTDAFTFVLVTLLLLVIALLASWIPARRAARVDPMVALRHQ